MEEIWKDIEGYDGLYQVSNLGRVRSWKKYRENKRTIPKILKQDINMWGYFYLVLSNKTNKTHKLVHRLVGGAFIPNPEKKPQINHIDGNRKNNNAKNIEWVTNKENSIHAHRLGLTDNRGGKNGQSKLTKNDIIDIRTMYALGIYTYRDIQEKYNISNGCVSMIINRKRWRHI